MDGQRDVCRVDRLRQTDREFGTDTERDKQRDIRGQSNMVRLKKITYGNGCGYVYGNGYVFVTLGLPG